MRREREKKEEERENGLEKKIRNEEKCKEVGLTKMYMSIFRKAFQLCRCFIV